VVSTTAPAAESTAPAPRVVSKLNPANAITASRFLTLPPFVWAVHNGHHQWATLFVLICGVLDKVDGLAAKIFDCRSTFSALFDVITDGIGNSGRRAIYAKRVGRATNYKSYAMEHVVAYTAFMLGFSTAQFEVTFYYWMYLPLMLVTILHDTKRMLIDPVPRGAP